MPAEAGHTADCARSYGMKLSWDINDPQMPQVREASLDNVAWFIRRRDGIQVLAETVDRPHPQPTNTRTHAHGQLGLEICLPQALSLRLSKNIPKVAGSTFPVFWREQDSSSLTFLERRWKSGDSLLIHSLKSMRKVEEHLIKCRCTASPAVKL